MSICYPHPAWKNLNDKEIKKMTREEMKNFVDRWMLEQNLENEKKWEMIPPSSGQDYFLLRKDPIAIDKDKYGKNIVYTLLSKKTIFRLSLDYRRNDVKAEGFYFDLFKELTKWAEEYGYECSKGQPSKNESGIYIVFGKSNEAWTEDSLKQALDKMHEFSEKTVDGERIVDKYLKLVENIEKKYLDQKNEGGKKSIDTESLKELLVNNHNIILHGAPGTGKTYLAKQIAKDLIFTKEEHDLIDQKKENVASDKKELYESLKKQFNERCGFVQFHQSYDYTDFVEGLRPTKNGTEIGFKLLPGVFKDFCEKALKKINESVTVSIAGKTHEIKMHFIFIIDEINRGEMSKIFGELFYSIDPGYRVEKEDLEKGKISFAIQTQYSNLQEEPNAFDLALGINKNEVEKDGKKDDLNKGKYGHFFVPENVYIIGTMNDIDRSVESMDFAMRRRFAFEEITAADRVEMLYDEDHGVGGKAKEAEDRMVALNKDIEKIDGLSSEYHIGPAYFLKLKNYKGDFDLLWKYHIEGVVKEYLRGMDNAEKNLRDLAKAYGYSKREIE